MDEGIAKARQQRVLRVAICPDGQARAHVEHDHAKIIQPVEDPFTKDGGLAVLFGNLAPDGSVIKSAGVDPSCSICTNARVSPSGVRLRR